MRGGVKGSGVLLLHGYLLEGSGSNLWTRSMARSLCRIGETVHLVCQENHPELYDFIAEAKRYELDGGVETLFRRGTPYPGRCILHKPGLGRTLPVYVPDRYEEFDRVVPMVDLPEAEIRAYLARNIEVVRRVARENEVHAIHANHAVLMPQVAEAVAAELGLPFAVMPHGSAIEYAVKRDERFRRRADRSFTASRRIFVIGPEMRARVRDVFGPHSDLDGKMEDLNLGVDTSQFEPVPPAHRPESIRRLAARLEGAERGRTPGEVAATRAALRASPDPASLGGLLAEPPGDPKRPDAGVEHALAGIDWPREPVLLFVGRLIAAKGPHAVVAAFPEVLRDAPGARLVVVGHGPLRLPLEAMVHALASGDRALLEALVATPFAEAPDGMPEVRAFLDSLGDDGRADYFDHAARVLTPDRVVFTGYLRHPELRHLFPCCDAAVFPSLVREAGPLVFLEALASGCVPMGTDFGGMAESLKALDGVVPPEVRDAARLPAEPGRLVAAIARGAPVALGTARRHRADLRDLAVRRYDWTSVARRFAEDLRSLAA